MMQDTRPTDSQHDPEPEPERRPEPKGNGGAPAEDSAPSDLPNPDVPDPQDVNDIGR